MILQLRLSGGGVRGGRHRRLRGHIRPVQHVCQPVEKRQSWSDGRGNLLPLRPQNAVRLFSATTGLVPQGVPSVVERCVGRTGVIPQVIWVRNDRRVNFLPGRRGESFLTPAGHDGRDDLRLLLSWPHVGRQDVEPASAQQ